MRIAFSATMSKWEKLVRVCKIRQRLVALLATGCLTNMLVSKGFDLDAHVVGSNRIRQRSVKADFPSWQQSDVS